MTPRKAYGKVTVVALMMLPLDHAFTFSSMRQLNRKMNRIPLFGSDSDYHDAAGDDGVEQARKQLLQAWDDKEGIQVTESQISAKKIIRAIIHSDISDFDLVLDDVHPPTPPLTTAERDRRMAELKMLEQLASSDEATQDLFHLWSSERGRGAQERLWHTEEMLEAGQVIAAENMIMKLIEDYGILPWVEPLNRLATVYFRQGKFEESYQLCACVLHLKPWHVGALEGIVAASMRIGDRDKARSWAEKGLPKLIASTSFPPFATTGPANPKRAEWVHDAIQQAQEALSHLEYQTQRDFLGNPEEYYDTAESTNLELEVEEDLISSPIPGEAGDDEDAWQ